MTIFNGGSDLDNGEAIGAPGAEVPDNDEESVGAYLLVNWDDDDGDGNLTDNGWQTYPVPDLSASETTVVNEDNLARLNLSTGDKVPQNGNYELEVVNGNDKIKLWTASTKSSQINLSNNKITWDLSNATERNQLQNYINNGIWIEGIEASDSERDVELVFRHCDNNGTEIMSDTVKATVVMLNLGAGLYRNMAFSWDYPTVRGHAGLLTKFNGSCTPADFRNSSLYTVHEMQATPNCCVTSTWKQLHDAATYWNEYGCTLTDVQRLKILKTAKWVESKSNPNIKYAGIDDVLEPNLWNGTLKTISALRCDGLVELCYEWNNIDVWGEKAGNGVVNYSIVDFTGRHNWMNYIFFWQKCLYPATQSGHDRTGYNTWWHTKFSSMDIIKPNLGSITW